MTNTFDDLKMNLRFDIPTYERLNALRHLAGHKGTGAMATSLTRYALLEQPSDIPIPSQPDIIRQPWKKLFVHFTVDLAEAVSRESEACNLKPSRFTLYVVRHALEVAAAELPELDVVASLRLGLNATSRLERYLPQNAD